MDWIQECYRNLFFDFHNHESVLNVAAGFDADKWAQTLLETGVQCVNVTSNDMFGWRYYQKGGKGFLHPNLPKGLDMVEETVRACHSRSIRVIAYYAPQRPSFVKDLSPQWLVRSADGTLPEAVQNGLCRIGPVSKDELLPQVEEITRQYDVDGIYFDGSYAFRPCFCSSCRELFRTECGLEIPTDAKHPDYKIYLKWYLDKHTAFKQDLMDSAHRGNPEVKVMDNWAYTYRLAEKMPERLDALKCDIEPANQLFHASLTARSFALTGKPFFIQNTGFLKWWGEWGIKPVATLKQEAATILANGGRVFTGYQLQPEFRVEKAVTDTFREVFEFVKERESICRDSSIVPYIGAFYSAVNRGVTHGSEVWPDIKAVMGIHKLLMNIGLHYNLLSDQNICKDIRKFKVVIISDMRYMDQMTAEAVREFVKGGGSLIVTGFTGTLDDTFAPTSGCIIEDVLGVKFTGRYPDSHGYLEILDAQIKSGVLDMPLMVEADFALVRPVRAKALASLKGISKRSDGKYLLRYSPAGEHTGYPFITVNEFGKGKAVYFAGDIFLGYYTGAQWNLTYLLKNILYEYFLSERLVEITGSNQVEVVLAEKNGSRQVHLVNHIGEMPAFGTEDICCITREVTPVYHLTVKLFLKEEPLQVVMLPDNRELYWERDGDYIKIEVPKLEIHICIDIILSSEDRGVKHEGA